MKSKSVIEIEIGGIKRGFKFGTYSMAVTCEKENCSLGVLIDRITQDEVQPMTILHVIYGGAVFYAKSHQQKIDFDETTVSDWLDELGFEVAMKLLRQGLEVYEPKNSAAPVMPGQ